MTLFQIRIIFFIVQLFTLAVGIVGVRKWNELPTPLRILNLYILFDFTSDVITSIMASLNIRNLWVNHWFTVIELFLFSCIYYYWRPSKRYGQLLWSAYLVYLIIWIIGKFTFEPFYYRDVYSGAVSQVIQIGFGCWLIYVIFQESDFEWKQDYRFLVVSGIVLYAASIFFLWTSYNILLTLPRPLMRAMMVSNFVFIVIKYIFFLRGFLCKMPIPSK